MAGPHGFRSRGLELIQQRVSGKIESLGLQVGRETETFRHRQLAGDILAPADAFARRIDVVVLQAARGDRFARAAALVVGGDLGLSALSS